MTLHRRDIKVQRRSWNGCVKKLTGSTWHVTLRTTAASVANVNRPRFLCLKEHPSPTSPLDIHSKWWQWTCWRFQFRLQVTNTSWWCSTALQSGRMQSQCPTKLHNTTQRSWSRSARPLDHWRLSISIMATILDPNPAPNSEGIWWHQSRTTANLHQGNGMVERFNIHFCNS